ncbi:MAG: MarR family transcriptional regulator [Anaerotignum sp.]|nr:MarR family transcriptional regulator [Anaerotignum sp.]
MQTATGREVVLTMLDLATDIAHWNKKYTTKTVLLKKLEELNLTSHQIEVLGFMYANPELDTVSAMAAEMFISKGSLSLMISKLENGGFVQKKAAKGDDDGRKVYVSLTEKGRNAVTDIRETMVESASVVFDDMDEEKRALFYTKVKELQELFNTGGWKE